MFADREQRAAEIGGALFVGGAHVAEFVRRLARVGNQFQRIDLHHRSQAVTTFARAVSRVERERARLERRHVDAAVHARHSFRVELLFAVDNRNQHRAAGQLQRGSNRIGQSFANAGLDQQPVDDGFDRVISSLVEPDLFVERQQFAIDARRRKPSFASFSSSFLNSPLRPRTIGASTITRSPSGSASTF